MTTTNRRYDIDWMRVIAIAITLFVTRAVYFQFRAPNELIALESNSWIISFFAFAYKYLNRSGKILRYLSQAVYPIYILHMLFLYLGSYLIFPMEIDVRVKFFMVLLFTVVGCFLTYEFMIRRVKFIRVLFGLK